MVASCLAAPPIGLKRALIIVDQYEELLKCFPVDALYCVNYLTNIQIRSGLAYVIFVVNSSACTRTLLNLNQGDRFEVLELKPAQGAGVRELDEELYKKCSENIGLYKNVMAKGSAQKPEDADVDDYIRLKLKDWEDDFHIPYPFKYDRSWKRLAEESVPFMKDRLGQALEQVLLAQKGQDSQQVFTPKEVDERVKIAARCWKDLSKMQVLDAMEPEWAKRLEGEGAKPAVAESLAEHIRRLIGNPVPDPPRLIVQS
ncbi:unnamed protein product [Symbiodinium necroappetens]|uniref:Uncharacterized protein n=1 Tax=Symbiodinium necroappetens TaxID=1628268 RepID=A0A812VSP7_9DINO|nr:unnamed protein product [Symbiodinium necroappetens]